MELILSITVFEEIIMRTCSGLMRGVLACGLMLAVLSLTAGAQAVAASGGGAAAGQGTAAVGLPATKVLAIGHRSAMATPEALRTVLPTEVRETVKLYLGGKIDQWYSRGDGKGVVFVMNVTTVEEAKALLEALPLGQRKLLEFEYIPLGPLSPLSLLVQEAK
jgi:hypothetical protein